MALPERNDTSRHGVPLPWSANAAEGGYRPGGHVGQLQTDLARRLAQDALVYGPDSLSPGERLVRRLSVAGGYLALLGGYGVAALLLLR